MLVLLIIFMVLTPTIMTGLPAVPPEGENLKARPEEPDDLTLGIDRAGAYYLNGQLIRAADLPAALRHRFSSRANDRVLYVRADKQLGYRTVLQAIAVAAESGVRVAALIGEPRSSSESAPSGAGPDAQGGEARR
jgi:biopolymer transport protein TolR